ncbi:hypothetical protein QNI16_05195 [Cytophagaceae bacterium YF14B1]|uniref:Lipoprotein n=1 Tax=Xanthocytophaga flava TaxID=3048013 RepID=A0AAE3QJP3_9BACT|nr:hypothetical protein [Xanthocytophaga flavus]MDJ1467636.1 hypothetical protein [Xanthocytophaga flavus]MDJ1479871.1 hypothetical protein [Xanthocytophaga flavus]
MKLYVVITLTVFLIGCMAKPEQPPLTELEKAYFDRVGRKCNCLIEREVNPEIYKKSDTLRKRGWYVFVLDSISCEAVEKKDSLEKTANTISRQLHRKILTKDFVYDYDHISIVFSCRSGVNSRNNAAFTYTLEDLDKMP